MSNPLLLQQNGHLIRSSLKRRSRKGGNHLEQRKRRLFAVCEHGTCTVEVKNTLPSQTRPQAVERRKNGRNYVFHCWRLPVAGHNPAGAAQRAADWQIRAKTASIFERTPPRAILRTVTVGTPVPAPAGDRRSGGAPLGSNSGQNTGGGNFQRTYLRIVPAKRLAVIIRPPLLVYHAPFNYSIPFENRLKCQHKIAPIANLSNFGQIESILPVG